MLDEPVRGGVPDRSLLSLSGLEQVRAFMRGLVLPLPVSVLFDLQATEATPGSSVMRQVLSPWFDSGEGTMHLTPLAETGMYAAVLTGTPPAIEPRTASLSIRYLRPCSVEAESVIARSRVLHSGSVFATAESLIEDRLGRAVAHATSSVLLKPIEPPPPPLATALEPVEPPVYATPAPARRPVPWGRISWSQIRQQLASCSMGEPGGRPPLPPVGELAGARLQALSRGRARVTMAASPWFAGMYGTATPSMVDIAGELSVAMAIATVADPDARILVNHAALNFLAPVVPVGQDLTADAVVRHQGDVIVCEAEVSEPNGAMVAVTQMTCVLRDPGSAPRARPAERVLLTVVFTDLVGSTDLAARSGPSKWRDLLEQHHAVVRRQLELHRGREVKCTGDGFLATFDSPTRAVTFARAARDGLDRLDLAVRIGIHAGECEVMGADVGGLAVHIASRIEGTAKPNEILVSGTVHDMLAGSGVPFVDRGRHALRGVEGDHQLFAVAEPDER
jgi:class 3 adenylate cyclase